MDPNLQIWKKLAGSLFDKLAESAEHCLTHISDPDRDVRIAAIGMCSLTWERSDKEFISACCQIAVTDPDHSVRTHAIGAIGRALRATRNEDVSHFLADLVKHEKIEGVCLEAYWALREIQLGLNEEDVVRRVACMSKSMWRDVDIRDAISNHFGLPVGNDPPFKRDFLGGYPETVWDSSEQIDWEFVNRFASKG